MADETNPFNNIDRSIPNLRSGDDTLLGFIGGLLGNPSRSDYDASLNRRRLDNEQAKSAYDIQQEQQQRAAQAEIMAKVSKIQNEQPNAQPQDIMRQIMLDPSVHKSLAHVPAGSHSKLLTDLQEATRRPAPKIGIIPGGSTQVATDPNTGLKIEGSEIHNSDNKELDMIKYFQSQIEKDPVSGTPTPAGQSKFDLTMQAWNDYKHKPSDESLALRVMERAGIMSRQEVLDHQAKRIHISPVTTTKRNQYGELVQTTNGMQIFNMRTGVTSFAPLPPGMEEAVNTLARGNGTGTGTGTGSPTLPPQSQAPEQGDIPVPGAPDQLAPKPALRTIGTGTEHQQPAANMFNAAGIVRGTIDKVTDMVGQVPTVKPMRPAEGYQERALAAWNSAVIDLADRGHTLKEELSAIKTMLPGSSDNAYSAAQKALTIRQTLEAKLNAYEAELKYPRLSEDTKKKLSMSIVGIENVLRLMPETPEIIAFIGTTQKNGQPMIGRVPNVGDVAGATAGAARDAASAATAPAPSASAPTPGAPAPAPAQPQPQPQQQQPLAPKQRTPEQKAMIEKAVGNMKDEALGPMIREHANDPDILAALRAEFARRDKARSNAKQPPAAPKKVPAPQLGPTPTAP